MPAPTLMPAQAGDDVAAAKAALRTRVRARRRAQDPGVRAAEAEAAAAHLMGWLGPRLAAAAAQGGGRPTVATVLPMPTEPDTGPLRARLHAAGARILVPVIAPERGLLWTPWTPGVPVARARLAPVDEPVGPRLGPESLAGAVALVLPGLAVDGAGMRLGQGGGYYDRLLAGMDAAVPRIAHVFSHEVFPAGAVPTEATDAPVDAVVTAAGLHWFGGGHLGSGDGAGAE
ncbi:5-formyltetrahydrofolate cyclo-ligase [Micrococcus sp.]|uniref:5-formyltetrahydrofolate cyclo-ligase n=1 Tax=Micrococcus sp. TaxID=1271 RepID=UPI002A91B570|nr:5-formyltetrahydrofolate cyclo-ligase [Micrococcus sp.]MDY6055813.1 5-formyltetrahydrofolate cyclo-ligase [Micrococcus sp.]